MSSTTSILEVTGLVKPKLHALRAQAKAAGVSAEAYAKQLIEEGVSLEEQARTKTFDELYATAQRQFRKDGTKEQGLDKLVDAARTRHHRHLSRKKA